MKRLLLIVTAVVLAVAQMAAAPVDAQTARAKASRYITRIASEGRLKAPAKASDIKLVLTQASKAIAGLAAYYVFNTNDSYIIVSGDDRAREVLAFGDSPLDIDNIPCNMQLWLTSYQEQLDYLLSHPDLVVEQPAIRRAPAASVFNVEPLLTAMWDQGEPYNRECPSTGTSLCVTGCGATSLAMIFHHWRYPTGPTSMVPGYTTHSMNLSVPSLPSTTFDWDNMLDEYRGGYNDVQASAVAHLMRYLGQSERMDYSPESSGTGTYEIVNTVRRFGYDNDVRVVSKESWWTGESYSDEEWGAIIQDELFEHRPILMCAYTPTWSGHAFDIDGYDATDDTYHINWGWSGNGNAFCALNAFHGSGMVFNVNQQLILGIEPPPTVPTIKAWSSRLFTTAYVDKTDAASFTVKGALLTGDVTVQLNDDSGYFNIDTEQISVDQLQQGKTVYVTFKSNTPGAYTATVTLSSEGAADKVITVYGTCLLETYDPVLLDVSDVTGDSFTVQWEDSTPSHNVVSYNLEIAPTPFFELRLNEAFDKSEYSGTSTSDWSSKLDEITSTPGWTGNKVYRSNNDLLLGTAKAKGWIETPALDMFGNNGFITVKVQATCTTNDTNAPLNISCEGNDTTIILDESEEEHCVLLPCPSGNLSKVKLTSATGKRVVLKNFAAYAGDDYSPVDLTKATYLKDITTMSQTVGDMTSGWYGLRIQALYTDGTLSPWSNRVRLLIDWKKGDVNHDGEINIADVNTVVNYIIQGINTKSALSSCDVNEDGEINLADINAVIRNIMGH